MVRCFAHADGDAAQSAFHLAAGGRVRDTFVAGAFRSFVEAHSPDIQLKNNTWINTLSPPEQSAVGFQLSGASNAVVANNYLDFSAVPSAIATVGMSGDGQTVDPTFSRNQVYGVDMLSDGTVSVPTTTALGQNSLSNCWIATQPNETPSNEACAQDTAGFTLPNLFDAGSPLIGRADPAWVFSGEADYFGTERSVIAPDVGAVER